MRFNSAIPSAFAFHTRKLKSWLCIIVSLLAASFASTTSAQTQSYFPYSPLFQFNIFYNMNLEIDPGATMPINGAVFCNAGIWAGNDNVTFNSTVAAVGLVYDNDTDPTNDDPWCSSKSDVGTSSGNFLYPPTFNQPQLNLPVGTNNNPSTAEALINLPPSNLGAPNPNAYTTNGQAYLFNECDLIISNSANGLAGTGGTHITIWYQNPNSSTAYLKQLSNDFYALKIGPVIATNVVNMTNGTGYDCWTNVAYAGFSFATNVSYYDYRENDNVQAVQIDVTNLSTWLTNQSATGGYQYDKTSFNDNGHGIQSIYIYNNVQPANGNPGILPAVRLIHGFQLPYTTDPNGTGRTSSGLTVATPQPIYVYGNYNVQTNGGVAGASLGTTNTANTCPAALMGDAITVLSANWNDRDTVGTSLLIREPSATTVNAACLEGIVQSTNSNYSGGVENFLRLEENWGGTVLTYNGSIAVLFPCIYATSFWPGTGIVYNAPVRNWGFDLNFTVPSKLPALTLLVFYYTNPPVIVTQPQSQTVVQGSNATFSVTITNSGNVGFQWNFNGTNIAGATNISLTLTNVQPNQDGNYAELVTNAFSSTLSSNAVLTVATPPAITVQPTNQTALAGNMVTFSVTPGGTPPLSYQWQLNGTNIFAATGNSLTVTVSGTASNLDTTILGSFQVIITNLYGSVTSAAAILTEVFPPSISIQQPNQSAVIGSNVTFNVTVAGTGPFKYQWQVNGTNLPNNIIKTVAGNGSSSYSGDGNVATNTGLSAYGVAVDAAGNVYIADSNNNRVRKVDINGIITTVATNVTLTSPWGIGMAADTAGNIYVANSYVYKLGSNGNATVVANISALSVAVDPVGNLYVIPIYPFTLVDKVNTNGVISTVAGNGSSGYSGDGGAATNASLNHPMGVAVDAVGNLYITDTYNNRIREVDTHGIITTVAGNGSSGYSADGGAATNTSINGFTGSVLHVVGYMYIPGQGDRVRAVDTNGIINTVAGNGTNGFSGDGGAATSANLSYNFGAAVDAAGNLYIADTGNHRIREVMLAGSPTLTLNDISATNSGNYSVLITGPYGSVTSSNAVLSVYATPAPALDTPVVYGGNQIQFDIAGVPGFNYAVQGSSNLIDWVPLFTNTSPFTFTDTNAPNLQQRFYRSVYLP